MGSRAEHKLKLLLKKVELQTPPENFTAAVMKEVEATAEDKVLSSPALVALLRKQDLPAPSEDFTDHVMNHVREVPSGIGQPLISKGAWVFIVLFVFINLIIAIAGGEEPGTSTRQFDLTSIGKYLTEVFLHFRETLFYLGIIVLASAVLLTMDYFFKRKLLSPRT